MSTKISMPRWLGSVGFGMCVGFLYFAATLMLQCHGWSHKLGEGGAASQWLDALDSVLWDFPLGHWISNGYLGHLLTGVLWGCLAGGLFAVRLWRKHAA